MSGNKKQRTTEETCTPVSPVVSCSDETQVANIMHLCSIPKSLTDNKLGSLQAWGLDWKRADIIVRTIIQARRTKRHNCSLMIQKAWQH